MNDDEYNAIEPPVAPASTTTAVPKASSDGDAAMKAKGEPVLQVIPGFEEVGEDVSVLVRVDMPKGTERTCSDIVCVLDVSGSMGTEATIQGASGASESNGLTLLDVAKHGVKTVINTLGPEDRFSVVAFDHNTEVLFELTTMDDAGKGMAIEKMDALRQRGATNIWGGLEQGLEVLKRGSAGSSRLGHVILLTDGQTTNRDTCIPSLVEYKAKHEGLPCTIHTFGFGYNIDSKLLVEMASQGSGTYSFIPDAGFVGTVFVNIMSNLLVIMARDAYLDLEPDSEAVITGVRGGVTAMDTGSGQKRVSLGTLHYGQSRDTVLQMSVKRKGDIYLVAALSYELPGGRKESPAFVEGRDPGSAADVAKVQPEFYRARFAETIPQAMEVGVPDSVPFRTTDVVQGDLEKASGMIAGLAKEISESESASSKQMNALLTDIQGQTTEAFSKKEWYDKWGRHYLPSLMFAHRLQICNNFKDPGVQEYGGDLFKELQDMADEVFNTLPPPVPTGGPNLSRWPSTNTNATTTTVSMAAYNDRSAG